MRGREESIGRGEKWRKAKEVWGKKTKEWEAIEGKEK